MHNLPSIINQSQFQRRLLVTCSDNTLQKSVGRMLDKTLTDEMQEVVNFSGQDMQRRSNSHFSDENLSFRAVFYPLFRGKRRFLKSNQNFG